MVKLPTDPLKAFIALRNTLEARRASLQAEIAEIDAALGAMAAAPAKVKTATAAHQAPKRAKNALSLKDAVVKAIAAAPLTKEDILAAVKKLGYKFTSKSPVNSLNALLYGKKPKFKTEDGKFSLA